MLLEDLVSLIKCEALTQPHAAVHAGSSRNSLLLLGDIAPYFFGDYLLGQPRQSHSVFGKLALGEVTGAPDGANDMHATETGMAWYVRYASRRHMMLSLIHI